jgi:hypothetical protein
MTDARKREPQNTEQGIMNVEGKENFIIRNSLFDLPAMRDRKARRAGIRYSK